MKKLKHGPYGLFYQLMAADTAATATAVAAPAQAPASGPAPAPAPAAPAPGAKKRKRKDVPGMAPALAPAANSLVAIFPPTGKHRVRVYESDLRSLEAEEYLNDSIIMLYLAHLSCRISSERARFKYLDVALFKLLKSAKDDDELWDRLIRRIRWFHIDSTNPFHLTEQHGIRCYLIIPINEGLHWSLAVCIIAIDARGKPEAKVMWLDSLGRSNPEACVLLAKMLNAVWNLRLPGEGNPSLLHIPWGSTRRLRPSQRRLRVDRPHVPHQPNSFDCGLYLCIYAEHFARAAVSPQWSSLHNAKDLRHWSTDQVTRKTIKDVIMSAQPSGSSNNEGDDSDDESDDDLLNRNLIGRSREQQLAQNAYWKKKEEERKRKEEVRKRRKQERKRKREEIIFKDLLREKDASDAKQRRRKEEQAKADQQFEEKYGFRPGSVDVDEDGGATSEDSDDFDLDGGDDTILTEVEVWLGTFQVVRTRKWPASEGSMADALDMYTKRLGKLHKWRLSRLKSKLRHKKVVAERDVVMEVVTTDTLLTQVDREEMKEEFVALHNVAAAYHAGGGEAVQDFVLKEDKISPQVLIDWSAMIENLRPRQIRSAIRSAIEQIPLDAAAPPPDAVTSAATSLVGLRRSQCHQLDYGTRAEINDEEAAEEAAMAIAPIGGGGSGEWEVEEEEMN
jgi:hypothetical protein